MSKKNNKVIIVGAGNECICGAIMERRKPKSVDRFSKSFYFTEWDFCLKCKRVQHYEEFKKWKDQSTPSVIEEDERQQSFLRSI